LPGRGAALARNATRRNCHAHVDLHGGLRRPPIGRSSCST
jgi:hypothetical protein